MSAAEQDGGRPATPRWASASLHVALLVLLGAIAYSGSLRGAFVYDDRPSIVENELIHGLERFLAEGYRARPNRALGYLTFALNREVNGLDVTGYHVVNLVIHLASALLVYALVRLTFRTPRLAASALAPAAPAIALLAAAIFVAHPMQTQAVTYVVQRLTSLAAMLYLACVVSYARWRTLADRGAVGRAALYGLVLVTAIGAMRTKEIAFTLPIVVVLWEICFFGRPDRRRMLALVPILATLAIIPATNVLSAGGLGGALSDAVESATRVQSAVSRWDYATTEIAVVATYLRLLVLPLGQNLDHDFPVATSLLDARVIGSALLLLAVAAAGVLLLRRERLAGAGRLAAFGVAWFFVSLAVESSVIPIVDVIAEHRVYLPSVGAFVAASACIVWVGRRWPRTVAVLATGAVVSLAAGTFLRNRVWKDELTLWSDVVAKSPDKARGHNSLGAALVDAGRVDEAARELTTAIRLDPVHAEAFYNLGRLHLVAGGDVEAAAVLLGRALELRPGWAEAEANLGAAFNRLGRFRDTVRLLAGSAASESDAEALFNLGVAYAALGDDARAQETLATLDRVSADLSERLRAYALQRAR